MTAPIVTPLRSRCEAVDLHQLVSDTLEQSSQYLSLGLASFESFSPSCALCWSFVAVSPNAALGPRVPKQTLIVKHGAEDSFGQVFSGEMIVPYFPGQLHIARAYETVSGKFYSCGNVCYSTNPYDQSPTRSKGHARGRIILQDSIDYSMVRSWIAACKEAHVNCNTPSFKTLKVINCKKRTVERTRDDEAYIALSYVWGSPTDAEEEPQDPSLFPARLPATVKMRSRSQYHSTITIYGLTGIVSVSTVEVQRKLRRSREWMRFTKAPRSSLLTSLVDISRRCTCQASAVLTNEQLYFECNVSACMETLCEPLRHPPAGIPSIRQTNVIPDIKTMGTVVINDYLMKPKD
ncbi:hypothetical protein F5Y18DRAFT_175690 [Xylariaceae sp. FL1019]|nr:hypothetical protein F5Y18DRAFT_175690 [Xylariaceae sp. FL1019]